ncbi:MAG: hypothetical protein GAK28_00625 [Luteibacter sp.]|uniref:hypothetical protein n=1 Tax=Luteibacter sp. TaxID=1886636 RepID=UPI00137F0D7A|nr:hypothetical protein [Luteibacter sp.]KAF1008993.1 MAG: hypothetical protein GAK28_00625 [Luteibacter sp.]
MKIDIRSDTWKEVTGWADGRLVKARAALESDATDHEQTLALRAQIKVLKALLELPNATSTTTESEVAFGIEPP